MRRTRRNRPLQIVTPVAGAAAAQQIASRDHGVAALAENHDVQAALSAKTPLVIGIVLALGFLLLLLLLGAARFRKAASPPPSNAPQEPERPLRVASKTLADGGRP